MLEVRNVTKTFGGFKALDGLNMTVEKGSVYGLVGPNGAGKSTIIRHITGVYRPDCGEITMDGQPIYENPEMKKRIASIPDDFYYFMSATTKDMMKFYKGIYPNFDTVRYNTLRAAFEEVDEKLHGIMKNIYANAAKAAADFGMEGNLVAGANIAGFIKVAEAMMWQGVAY